MQLIVLAAIFAQITDADRISILQADLVAAKATVAAQAVLIQKLQSPDFIAAVASQNAANQAADAKRAELAKKCESGVLLDGKQECKPK